MVRLLTITTTEYFVIKEKKNTLYIGVAVVEVNNIVAATAADIIITIIVAFAVASVPFFSSSIARIGTKVQNHFDFYSKFSFSIRIFRRIHNSI